MLLDIIIFIKLINISSTFHPFFIDLQSILIVVSDFSIFLIVIIDKLLEIYTQISFIVLFYLIHGL